MTFDACAKFSSLFVLGYFNPRKVASGSELRRRSFCRLYISENIRKDPQAIYGITTELMVKVMQGSSEEINNAVIDFNQQLLDYVKHSCEPLLIIKQELNALFLIASSELLTKLDELKDLITDFNDEAQNCLSRINVKDGNSFQVLNTLGQTARWQRFKELNEEIISLMRKEIDI